MVHFIQTTLQTNFCHTLTAEIFCILLYNTAKKNQGFLSMHLQLPHELLLKSVDLVAKVADKHHRYAILANIHFELTQTYLKLTASDLEVTLSTILKLPEGACIQAGATTIAAGKLHEICKSLPTGMMVEINTTDDGRCLICAGKSKFTLGTLPASDFPSMGTPNNQNHINIARGELLDMISRTRFSMAIQDVRHYLTGMLFQVEDNQLTCVATDGHRLSVAYRPLAQVSDKTIQIIVPGKAVVELERLFGELGKVLSHDDVVALGVDGEFLEVQLNFGQVNEQGIANDDITVTMLARLIEGKFPDYRRVLPTNCDRTALINKDDIMNVLKRVSILSNERSRGVIFEFGDADTAIVRSGNSEQGEAVESLAVDFQGEPLELSLNESYLKSVFNVLQGKISIQMSHPNSPTLIKQIGDERHQYVVMPMRI